MHKTTSRNSKLRGGLVTRLTGRREYIPVGLTAAISLLPTPVNRATEPLFNI